MLYSPISNAKSPASAGSQTLPFDANRTIQIKPALREDGKPDGFTVGRAPTAKDSARQSSVHVKARPCRRWALARRFIQDGVARQCGNPLRTSTLCARRHGVKARERLQYALLVGCVDGNQRQAGNSAAITSLFHREFQASNRMFRSDHL
jgi:hypothetical protein